MSNKFSYKEFVKNVLCALFKVKLTFILYSQFSIYNYKFKRWCGIMEEKISNSLLEEEKILCVLKRGITKNL